MHYPRFVLYHPSFGIYLGSFLGLGFWSQLDPCGQPEAVVFESEVEADQYVSSWDNPVPGCYPVKVLTARPDYATIAECVLANLPSWNLKHEENTTT